MALPTELVGAVLLAGLAPVTLLELRKLIARLGRGDQDSSASR